MTRELFLDFINEPVNSARSLDSDSPIHQDYVIETGNLKIHLMLLDNRYEFDLLTRDHLGEQ